MKPEDFIWHQNSRTMYDATVNAAPAFVRPILKSKLLRAIKEKAGDAGVINEAIFFDALKASTPASKLEKILGELEKLKTT